MGTYDIVIRNGTVIDGTGAPARQADVAIAGDRVVAVAPGIIGSTTIDIDAEGKLVTPGFVDIHTHLDAQLAWDPIGSSSCYHGITSVVMGNCGVTFAPCKPEDRQYLAELMESVEDIPRDAIMSGLPWDWVTYGEYLASVGRMPKGVNVGGMVGHCALRQYAMGERSLDQAPPTADDLAVMGDLLDEAMKAGGSPRAAPSCTGCPMAARYPAPMRSPTSCTCSPMCSGAMVPACSSRRAVSVKVNATTSTCP